MSDSETPESEIEERAEREDDLTWGDRLLMEGKPLSPRHRKLAELAAQGMRNADIAKELHLTQSRVSILISNTKIREAIEQHRERIWEETVGARLKRMSEPALAEIERCLTDKTNRYKENLKVDTAKWLVEKLDGKATQRFDVGENLLGVMMDRLDAMKASGGSIEGITEPRVRIAAPKAEGEIDADFREVVEEPTRPKTEEDELAEWAAEFTRSVR